MTASGRHYRRLEMTTVASTSETATSAPTATSQLTLELGHCLTLSGSPRTSSPVFG